MNLSAIDYVLWLAAPLLQVGVVDHDVSAWSPPGLPLTSSITQSSQVIAEPILVSESQALCTPYTIYAYYVNIALSVVISFAVLQEIFKDAFRPYEALRDLSLFFSAGRPWLFCWSV